MTVRKLPRTWALEASSKASADERDELRFNMWGWECEMPDGTLVTGSARSEAGAKKAIKAQLATEPAKLVESE